MNNMTVISTKEARVVYDETFTTATNIVANGNETIFSNNGDYHAYGPFDTLVIDSTDSVELSVYTDHETGNKINIPPQSSKEVTGLNFRTVHVLNEDGATAHTLGKIKVKIQAHNKLRS